MTKTLTGKAIYNKYPGEVLTYGVDFSARLAGEVISATKWGWYMQAGISAIASATASASGSNGHLIEVTLSGGSYGSGYWVSGHALTSASALTLFSAFNVHITGATGNG